MDASPLLVLSFSEEKQIQKIKIKVLYIIDEPFIFTIVYGIDDTID